MSATRGALVVLEGAEGVGKTTQVGRLSAWLTGRGVAHLSVREPGSTPLGDEIRRLLLSPGDAQAGTRGDAPLAIGERSEALLFMAARAQLVSDVVAPALRAGHLVLADRFFLSTYAYQVGGRGLDEEDVRRINAFAAKGVIPDVTILLDLPVGEGLDRATGRGPADRIETSGDGFHARVSAAFVNFADSGWQRRHPECGPIVRCDASGSEDLVFERVLGALVLRLPETFAAAGGSQR